MAGSGSDRGADGKIRSAILLCQDGLATVKPLRRRRADSISQVGELGTISVLLCIGASCPVLLLQGQDSLIATLEDVLLPYCRHQLVYTKIYNKNKTICSVNYSKKL